MYSVFGVITASRIMLSFKSTWAQAARTVHYVHQTKPYVEFFPHSSNLEASLSIA